MHASVKPSQETCALQKKERNGVKYNDMTHANVKRSLQTTKKLNVPQAVKQKNNKSQI